MRKPESSNARSNASSKLTRRSMIGQGAAVAGAVMLPSLASANDMGGRSRMRPLVGGNLACQLPEDHWANFVEQKFQVNGIAYDPTQTSFRSELELLETSKVSFSGDKHRPSHFKSNATVLLFRGPANFQLPSATYRMHHQLLGDFDLMISYTEIKKYIGQNIYVAVLNN